MSWNVVDVFAGALILLLTTPGPGGCQEPEWYAVVVTDGADTVAVERVTRTVEWMHAVILVRDRARIEVTETFGPSRCATGAVMDGPKSRIRQEAQNAFYAKKALYALIVE